MIETLKLNVFTPYSRYSNEIIFNKLLEGFNYKEILKDSLSIDKALFEEKLHNHFNLQQAYVEVYVKGSEFYTGSIDNSSFALTYYVMIKNEKLIFAFLSSFIQNPPVEGPSF